MKAESIVHPSELTELTSERGDEATKDSRQLLRSIRAADWWVWEILSLGVSAIALGAIIFLLSSLDNKPQPLWASAKQHCVAVPGSEQTVCRRSGITVNSVVSWLGTLARICLLLPLSNGLGQLKWSWYSYGKNRPLADLDTFDAASRGLTGSIQLIWLLKARHFAALGALGMILSIAFDPFVQNLVGYQTKLILVPEQSAFVANNIVYETQPYTQSNYLVINPTLKGSIFNALFSSDSRHVWSEPYHTCGTGECTWPPIASIGICTSCRDTTASVNKDCKIYEPTSSYDMNCSLSLPYSRGPPEQPDVSVWYAYKKGATPIGRLFAISSTGGKADTTPRKVASIYVDLNQQDAAKGKGYDSEPAFKSSICTISPCIQSIQSTYRQSDQNPYQEKLLKSWTSEDLTPKSTTMFNELPAPNAPEYNLYGNQTYSIESRTLSGLQNFIGDTLNGYFDKQGSTQDFYQWAFRDGVDSDVVFALWNSNYTGCADAHKDNRISCGLDLVAKAMSKTFRDAPYTTANDTYNNGDAFAPVIHVSVRWYWIALPILIWALALAMFLGMVWKASEPGLKAWRNSVLPIAFMSVEHLDQDMRDASVDQKSLKGRAEALTGTIRVTERDVRFMS